MLKHWMLGIAFALLLAACESYQPMDVPQSDEIPEGPGLFTGEKGVWTISF